MNGSRIQAILCPNCRKLINADEAVCPYCGIASPGSRWKSRLGKLSLDEIVTYILYTNAAMYILSILLSPRGIGLSGNPLLFLSPSDQSLLLLGATGTLPIERFGRWWSLISAGYLHGGLLHIFFNMMALRQIGPLVIREFGIHRMVVIYTLGSVAGFVVSYLAGVRFTIGASAALCSLIGAALYYGKSRGGVYGEAVFRELGKWVIFLFLFGFLVPGINNWAHGGGIAAGAALGALLGYSERRRETVTDRLLSFLSIVSTVGILLWALISSLILLIEG